MEYLLLVVAGFAGAALFVWSKPLSRKYNGWTTSLRTKYPNINPPPTPQAAELNYKIIVVLLRVMGAALFVVALWVAYETLLS